MRVVSSRYCGAGNITEDDSKQDQILLVKIYEYIGFCFHRRSCLLGSPVIVEIEVSHTHILIYRYIILYLCIIKKNALQLAVRSKILSKLIFASCV